jgi:hypothetical protein
MTDNPSWLVIARILSAYSNTAYNYSDCIAAKVIYIAAV